MPILGVEGCKIGLKLVLDIVSFSDHWLTSFGLFWGPFRRPKQIQNWLNSNFGVSRSGSKGWAVKKNTNDGNRKGRPAAARIYRELNRATVLVFQCCINVSTQPSSQQKNGDAVILV